ncbi:MAG: hypothetical protein GF334_12635 [Candidatus Altiarchaeales archaeon]|nr:hypothetical protein [Candidatus Altiarchaeales archaeon]
MLTKILQILETAFVACPVTSYDCCALTKDIIVINASKLKVILAPNFLISSLTS